MVVVREPKGYDEWPTCSKDEALRYFRQWMRALEAAPAPLPPRANQPEVEGAAVIGSAQQPDEPWLF